MVKSIFSLIILIHGLIHMLGFFKAFELGDITQLTIQISRPAGVIWLIATFLFLMTAWAHFMNYSFWPCLALAAIFISQILIFTAWGDAKFGTIANVILLIVAIPAVGHYVFSNMTQNEQAELIEQVCRPSNEVISEKEFSQLPAIVQKWIRRSGVPGKPDVFFVRLKQTGEMRTEPDGRWMNFSAVQYFDVKNPAFNWSTDVQMMPLVHLAGRDKLKDGQGEMIIKLFSLFNVVDEANNEKINSGTMIRFLGEICWFPSAALNEYISWEEIDELSAKATLVMDGENISGIFRFSEEGDFRSFEAERYYGGGQDAALHRWMVEAIGYQTFDGYRIPNKLTVTWKLPEGDFTWLNLEITDLDVNRYERYFQ